jgi:hypothetical protein
VIAHCEEKIASLEKDIALKSQSMGEEFLMCIDGKIFDERVLSGERLIMMSKLHNISVNGEPLEVGTYRGFKLLLTRVAFDHLEVQIKGALIYHVELGDSELGSITRIENAIDKIDSLLIQTKQKLEDAIVQLAEAKKEVKKPSGVEERLAEFTARQAEINTKLEFKELRQQEEVVIDENGQGNDSHYLSEGRAPELAIAERDV